MNLINQFIIINFLFITNCVEVPAQNKYNAEEIILNFYEAYMSEYSSNNSLKIMSQKLDSIQREYCTEELVKSVPQIVEETGADAFIRAQDCNFKSIETLIVKRHKKDQNIFFVSYVDISSSSPVRIGISVSEKNQKIRIDSVWDE